MTKVNGGNREERAKEALIVSALYKDDSFDENIDIDRLPELTEDEEKAMKSLGPDFIGQIIEGKMKADQNYVSGELHNKAEDELALAGGTLGFGLDRADEIDDLTFQELEKQRQEILDRKRREQEKNENSGGA
jgi:hypothetical protein